MRKLPKPQRDWLNQSGFTGKRGTHALLPRARGGVERAVFVADKDTDHWSWSNLAAALPKAGYRMGEAIPADAEWPKRAVYPILDEIADALGEPIQPFVLLLDPEDSYGFFRHWVPEEMGPGRHYAYALQWFGMGIVLAGLLIWNFRKRGFES